MVAGRSLVSVLYGICPDCLARLYPDLKEENTADG